MSDDRLFVCVAPDGRLYVNAEGRDEPVAVLPKALTNLLAYAASPPEYPGLVLVPAADLDELRRWAGFGGTGFVARPTPFISPDYKSPRGRAAAALASPDKGEPPK